MKTRNQLAREQAVTNYYLNPNTCRYCGFIISVKDKQKIRDVRRKRFCNKNCAASFNNKLYPKRKCKTCKVILVKRKRNKFCSKICKTTINLDSSSKGQLFSRCRNWQAARSTIQHNARRVYFSNDKEKACKVCGYTLHVEVAHIKPVAEFDNETLICEINAMSNLVALCPTHHWEFDKGLLKFLPC